MAQFDANGVVFAVAMAVAKQTDFSRVRCDLLDIDSEFVLGASLFPPIDRILHLLVIKGASLV